MLGLQASFKQEAKISWSSRGIYLNYFVILICDFVQEYFIKIGKNYITKKNENGSFLWKLCNEQFIFEKIRSSKNVKGEIFWINLKEFRTGNDRTTVLLPFKKIVYIPCAAV